MQPIAMFTALCLCSAMGGAMGCATSTTTKAPEAEQGGVPATLRHPPAGSVIGTNGLYGGYSWLGIPYAVPPVGKRRFRKPNAAAAWSGTHQATAHGASCPQYATSMGGDTSVAEGSLTGNEDCLFLNVYAPEGAAGGAPQDHGSLPVMFWIHGGGNVSGTSSFYEGSRLASEQQVVVVSVNYRLGFLGWFRHRALRAGVSATNASGNFGTLDLIRALDWVQENIAAFGGDPGNVTIFGESAGGWNVVSLMASPLASGKFHRAIAQSSLSWSFSPARAENYRDDPEPGEASSSGEAIVSLMIADGRADDRESAKQAIAAMDDTTLANYLRNKSVAELFAVYDPDGDGEFTLPRLFEDGKVLPAQPLAHAFRPGMRFNRVPVILGTNKDEEKLFLLFNPEYTSRFFGFIPRLRDRARYLRDAETITRIWRMMAVDELAKDLSRSLPGEVFSYRFDWDEEPKFLWFDLSEMIGAAHGFEIPFVFGHWNLGPDSHRLFDDTNRPGREALSSAMMSYWTEFATRGHPGRGRDGSFPHWAAWTEGAARFAILDTEAGGGLRMTEGSETADEIAASIVADSSYESLRRRCMALASIYDWAPLAFTVEDYSEVGRGLCHEFPIDQLLESF
ncbi:MAG: carboxylesterase family protein [Deltaproteobacteria bacterium]|nr:carboxylesterase family protein [Deltaproteobacteria bacterium]MBW2724452.1 carboxylesterase family protein [Deltaproteobacteria bacterium]